ncbi:MAG TPA: hypothetical protein IGS37_16280 [Synechococcales cyanobacterium M55_K2018_004]|nr:hypothetical protein [Synechococcales cyanobacterium M55_K2018_004]
MHTAQMHCQQIPIPAFQPSVAYQPAEVYDKKLALLPTVSVDKKASP